MVSQAAEVFENNLQILKDEAKWRNKRDMVASGTETSSVQYFELIELFARMLIIIIFRSFYK